MVLYQNKWREDQDKVTCSDKTHGQISWLFPLDENTLSEINIYGKS